MLTEVVDFSELGDLGAGGEATAALSVIAVAVVLDESKEGVCE